MYVFKFNNENTRLQQQIDVRTRRVQSDPHTKDFQSVYFTIFNTQPYLYLDGSPCIHFTLCLYYTVYMYCIYNNMLCYKVTRVCTRVTRRVYIRTLARLKVSHARHIDRHCCFTVHKLYDYYVCCVKFAPRARILLGRTKKIIHVYNRTNIIHKRCVIFAITQHTTVVLWTRHWLRRSLWLLHIQPVSRTRARSIKNCIYRSSRYVLLFLECIISVRILEYEWGKNNCRNNILTRTVWNDERVFTG